MWARRSVNGPLFRDRDEAGRALAAALAHLRGPDVAVLALPRGGVPVAVPVARALEAPLDVFVVRKLGVPGREELAMGAIASGGAIVLNREVVDAVRFSEREIERVADRELAELRRRERAYRGERPAGEVRGKTVVLIDDGLATGSTMAAAARAVRERGAGRLVVAAPVGSVQACRMLREVADEVVCLHTPQPFVAVGEWYRDFRQISDDEVCRLLAEAPPAAAEVREELELVIDGTTLRGQLAVPAAARGLVLFAHGSGSSHRSPRNQAVAADLRQSGFGTLLFDLLDAREARRRELVFDVKRLAARLVAVTRWTRSERPLGELALGYFGASTGAAAGLIAAAQLGDQIDAIVSRGGRPDLAAPWLAEVRVPTLLIVGSADRDVLRLNRRAAAGLQCRHKLAVVEGAGHLFEEPGALEEVARLAVDWFSRHLPPGRNQHRDATMPGDHASSHASRRA